ncbi:MAG: YggT family protein [Gammaproteobacteria bacterium]|nr:YggT family protein [Gammaproteobacteria bacterium]
MNGAVLFVIRFLLEIAGFLFLARFLLQACRVDFYNPISQGIVKVTDPVLKPLRSLLPGYRNFDLASFAACWVTAAVMIYALALIAGHYPGGVMAIIGGSLLHVLLRMLDLFWWCILIVIIASFIAPGSFHPVLGLLQQITEPLLRPARRLIPPLGGLDFSPILVILALGVVQRVLPTLFGAVF